MFHNLIKSTTIISKMFVYKSIVVLIITSIVIITFTFYGVDNSEIAICKQEITNENIINNNLLFLIETLDNMHELEYIGKNAKDIHRFKNIIDGSIMILILGGSFKMGSDHQFAFAWEKPVHLVTLSPFLIDEKEITREQFKKFIESSNSVKPIENIFSNDADLSKNHPITNITWKEAYNYCKWAGKRLPTEAEWEYAARGGLEGTLYPWGNDFDCRKGNFNTEKNNNILNQTQHFICDKYKGTAPVGSFPANAYGLFDILGNVGEWCNDWFSHYQSQPVENPQGTLNGEERIVRGASFRTSNLRLIRTSNRTRLYPNQKSIDLGCRCSKGINQYIVSFR